MQLTLFVQRDAAPKRRPPVRLNKTVTEADKPRLRASLQRLLDALREGPKTNADLAAIAGFRFGARLAELRDAGYRIESEQGEGSSWTYTLTGEKR